VYWPIPKWRRDIRSYWMIRTASLKELTFRFLGSNITEIASLPRSGDPIDKMQDEA
jgi:hypothetical protein